MRCKSLKAVLSEITISLSLPISSLTTIRRTISGSQAIIVIFRMVIILKIGEQGKESLAVETEVAATKRLNS
jgi:hypothetical protein